MGSRSGELQLPTDQHGLFPSGGHGRGMAPKSAGVCETVPRRETPRKLSPDGDSTSGPASRPGSGTEKSFRDQKADEYESLRLCAAKTVWPIRTQRTPSRALTWEQWFENKFGISLYQLREQQRKKKEV
ncbi:MAG: hypothetical protein GY922_19265 [Proteobacteria bacterium]|nr:hypothetical protein [Pseudomonadota bacterium]